MTWSDRTLVFESGSHTGEAPGPRQSSQSGGASSLDAERRAAHRGHEPLARRYESTTLVYRRSEWERMATTNPAAPVEVPDMRTVIRQSQPKHACGRFTLARHFRGKPPAIRALFKEVVAAIRAIGPVHVLLREKTRIAFQVRMSFAQVTPRQAWLDGHLVLARRLEHPRFGRVKIFSPRNHLHMSG